MAVRFTSSGFQTYRSRVERAGLTPSTSRGGGRGISRLPQVEIDKQLKAKAEAKAAAEKAAADRRAAEQRATQQKAQQRIVEQRAAQKKIEQLAVRLKKDNARTRTKDYIVRDTGEKVRHDTTFNRKGERIFTTTNIGTGVAKTRIFETPKGGGRVRETAGLISTPPTPDKLDTGSIRGDTIKFELRQIGETKGTPDVELFAIQGGVERPATAKEEDFFREKTSVEQASDKKAPSKIEQKAISLYGSFQDKQRKFSERTALRTSKLIKKKTGKDISEIGGMITSGDSVVGHYVKTPTQLIFPSLSIGETKVSEFKRGVGEGITQDVLEKPISNAALFGAGAAVGAGLTVGSKALKVVTSTKVLSKAEKIISPVTASILKSVGMKSAGKTPKIGKAISSLRRFDGPVAFGTKVIIPPKKAGRKIIGLGAGGFMAQQVGADVLGSSSIKEAGGKVGVVGKDLTLFGAGSIKGAREFKVIETRTPVRKIKDPVAIEKVVRVQGGGKEFRVSEFKIKGEVRPPIRVTKTTKFGQRFGLKPKTRILPARKFEVETLSPAINSNPFDVRLKVGKTGTSKLISIEGGAKRVKLRDEPPTKIDALLRQRLASRKAGGRPVLREKAGSFFGKDEEGIKSSLVSKERYGLKVSKKISKRKLKLSPEDYAKAMSESGQINFATSKDLGKDTLGRAWVPKKGAAGKGLKPTIHISSKLDAPSLAKLRKEVIRHEIFHVKGVESEFLAHRLDKLPIKFKFLDVKKNIDINIKTPKPGKTTQQMESLSTVRKIKDTDKVIVSEADTLFKDVSKPFARATGKTPALKTTIIEAKKPLVLDDVTGVKSIKPGDIIKTPLSKTFAGTDKQILESSLAKPLPKIIPPATKMPSPKTIVDTPRLGTGIPTAVGGLGLTESQIAKGRGTVTFIETPGSVGTLPPAGKSIFGTVGTDIKTLSDTKLNLGTQGKYEVKTLSDTLSKGRSIVGSVPSIKTKIDVKSKAATQQLPALKQTVALKQAQKLQTTSLTARLPSLRTPAKIRIKKPPVEKILLPPPKSSKGSSKLSEGLFGVSVRRRGKFRTIGRGLSLKDAISTGQEKVGSTLAATFKVTPTRKGISFGSLRTPAGFRKKVSKKEGVVFIERRGLRLSKAGELKEIQTSKRVKGGIY